MKATITQNGKTTEADNEDAIAALESKTFFWLDIDDAATDGTVAELLGDPLRFPPLGGAGGRAVRATPPLR